MVKKAIPSLMLCAVLVLLSSFLLQEKEQIQNSHSDVKAITTGLGPEDFALDMSTGKARLLVGCDARRRNEVEESSIYVIDMENDLSKELERRNEPEGLVFHPHGVDVQQVNGKWYFYLISHNDNDKEHSILQYEIHNDHLTFIAKFDNDLLISPNDLTVRKDGSMFVTNDTKKRYGIWEVIFNMKHGSIIYFDGQKGWKMVAKKIRMANGILADGDDIYLATVRDKALMKYKFDNGNLTEVKNLSKMTGLDNLTMHGDELIVARHPKFGAFIKHSKDPDQKAPAEIYSIHKNTGEAKLLYSGDGNQVSAPSTGLIYNHSLYIAQVFDAFVLKVDLD